MKLIKTILSSGVITFIRISAGFVSTKFIALFTGPAGVAVVGQFVNFVTIILTFANGAVSTGVTKYAAEYESDPIRLRTLFSSSIRISVFCSLLFGSLLFMFAEPICIWVLRDANYQNVVQVFGLTVGLYAINSLLLAILNGLKKIRQFTIVNTVGSIVGLIFTIVLVYFFRLQGALYAMVLAQSIICIFTCVIIYRSPWFSWSYFNDKLDVIMLKKLGAYALMAIVSAITLPLAQIILRNIIIKEVGLDSAGYWQGIMKISDGYLMVVTTGLSTYYLPKLSSLKNDHELKKEVNEGYKLLIPVLLGLSVCIYLARYFIIEILYSHNFLPMESLFFYQLLGDFFKLSAWILAYLMLSRAMTKAFIVSEVLFSIFYVILSYILVLVMGLKGVVVAFAINYACYWLFMIVYFRKLLFTGALKSVSPNQ